ncbi:MAG: EAL domain-containing protein [Propionivibrio sp.]|uniref:bifunctional diguanylate cyclase/phosphodiesterase n=1 Tax=Propionivibrio sp. TaxID=2212460 RepID=UPI001A453E15|nr:EAL domain-containing protein [Propionivibrio sp.]MBL8415759.1 EAL domain-containing protein [Propionivibrio sp.]
MRLSWRFSPLLLAAVFGLMLAGSTGYKLVRERNADLDLARSQTENIARVLEENSRQTLHRVGSNLRQADTVLGQLRSSGEIDHEQVRQHLMTLLPADRLIRNFLLLDRTGALVMSTLSEDVLPTGSSADRDYFIPHVRGADRELVFGAPQKASSDGQWVLPVSRRISRPDGVFDGVLVAMVKSAYFQSFFDSIDRGENSFVTLYLSSGLVAVTSPHDEAAIGQNWSQSPLFREHLPLWPTGTVREVMARDGVERIYSYRALNDYPVVVTFGLPLSAILSGWHAAAWFDGLLLLCGVILLFAAAVILLHHEHFRRAAEKALKNSEQDLAITLHSIADGVIATNETGHITRINAVAQHLTGWAQAEALGRSLRDVLLVLKDQAMPQAGSRDASLALPNPSILQSRDGTQYRIAENSAPILDASGQIVGRVLVFRDVTEQYSVQQSLAESRARYRSLIEFSPVGIAVHRSGCIVYVNPAVIRMLGAKSAAELQGRPLLDFVHPDFRQNLLNRLQNGLEQDAQGEMAEERLLCLDGSVIDVEIQETRITYEGAKATQLSVQDITQRKRAEAEINQLAFYDQLTGLPNRRLLTDRLHQALATRARHQRHGALLFIDLDNFKALNDSLGHDKGDILLHQVAQRLVTGVRACDTVARLGGDEFVVMLDDLSENARDAAAQTEIVGEKILAALNQTYLISAREHHSTASIGITLFREHTDSVDELMKRADTAMYQAKAAGRNTLRFFDHDMQVAVTTRAALEVDLRRAIKEQQFLIYYQAQLDSGGRVLGAEALLRWPHPERGLVSPAEFIPLAEDTGLILPLGQWVLETACERLALWASRPELADLSLAVNVSARQFHHRDFVEQVLAALVRSGANPQRLKLELTESLLVHDMDDIIVKMTALKEKGVGFSLDDFGTGYSSLSYLKRLPLDQLKIDQSFVRDILTDPDDAAIARMIIVLGESLGLTVIAEGVESEDQRDFLATQGCRVYQGYLFSRPLPVESFEKFLQQG